VSLFGLALFSVLILVSCGMEIALDTPIVDVESEHLYLTLIEV
jgi:hypothetical protein